MNRESVGYQIVIDQAAVKSKTETTRSGSHKKNIVRVFSALNEAIEHGYDISIIEDGIVIRNEYGTYTYTLIYE